MKPILFSILFILLPKMGISQVSNNEIVLSPNDTCVFLDSTNVVTKSMDYAYIRVVKDSKLVKESYAVQEYYRSGVVRMEGASKTNNGYSYDGEVVNYYKNGVKKSTTNYVKGLKNGKDFEWYENGSKKLEGEYVEDDKKGNSKHKTNQFWDENGVQKVVDGNGFLEEKGEKESSKGDIKNGFKEGIWEYTVRKDRFVETYKGGKFISGEHFDENNVSNQYTELETKPKPKNGMDGFYRYIGKSFNLSQEASRNNLTGKIYVTFIVDIDGKIVEPKVLRDIGYGTGEEALRVLKNCDNWTPGEQRGRKVRCRFSLPISVQSRPQEQVYQSPFKRSNGF